MKKHFFTILCLFLLINYSHSQTDLSVLYKKSAPAICLIKIYDERNEPIASGSGFFIDKNGLGVSCAHVFKDGSRAEVQTNDGLTYSIKLFKKLSVDADLALFQISLPASVEVKTLQCDYQLINRSIGQEVFTIGSPLGLESTLSNGIISSLREYGSYGKIIQTTVPISSGSSGSPLLNKFGKVIGVITFTFIKGQNINFAIDISQLNSLPNINNLEFPKTIVRNLPFSIKDFEKAEWGIAKEMIKAREWRSRFDEANTYLCNEVSSVHDNYTSWLCYEGIKIDNLVSNLCYEFKHNYLSQIKFESQGFRRETPSIQLDFTTTLKEFVDLLNMLELLYGEAKNEASIEYCEGCYSGDVSIFRKYSYELEEKFKRNKWLVVCRFVNQESDNQLNLIGSYSGMAKEYPYQEEGLWWLTIKKNK